MFVCKVMTSHSHSCLTSMPNYFFSTQIFVMSLIIVVGVSVPLNRSVCDEDISRILWPSANRETMRTLQRNSWLRSYRRAECQHDVWPPSYSLCSVHRWSIYMVLV